MRNRRDRERGIEVGNYYIGHGKWHCAVAGCTSKTNVVWNQRLEEDYSDL